MTRRHGPGGYADYSSYRPWLRDDFTFRCVYCLIRERWGRVTGEFDLDHFAPQALNAERSTEYENLFYACHPCNLRKGPRELPDASSEFTREALRLYPNGEPEGLTTGAKSLIRALCLNSPKLVRWRQCWLRIVALAEEHDPGLFADLMGYPDDLPDLSKLSAPSNSKPEGVGEGYFARRERGELPEVYSV